MCGEDKNLIIGVVGSTSNLTDLHLHWEIRYNRPPISPVCALSQYGRRGTTVAI